MWGDKASLFNRSTDEDNLNRGIMSLVSEIGLVRQAMARFERVKTDLNVDLTFGDDQMRRQINELVPGVHYGEILKDVIGKVISGMTCMAKFYDIEEETKAMMAQVLEAIQSKDKLVRKALSDHTNDGLSIATYLELKRSSPTKEERKILAAVSRAVEYSPFVDIGGRNLGGEEHIRIANSRLDLMHEPNRILDQDYIIASKKLRYKYHEQRLRENYLDAPRLLTICSENRNQEVNNFNPIITRVDTVNGDINVGASGSGTQRRGNKKRQRTESEITTESE